MKRSLILVIAAAVLVVGAVLVFRPKPTGPLEVVPAGPPAAPVAVGQTQETTVPQPAAAIPTAIAEPPNAVVSAGADRMSVAVVKANPAPVTDRKAAETPTPTPAARTKAKPESAPEVEISVTAFGTGEGVEGIPVESTDGVVSGGPWVTDNSGKAAGWLADEAGDRGTAMLVVGGPWVPLVGDSFAVLGDEGGREVPVKLEGTAPNRRATLRVAPARQLAITVIRGEDDILGGVPVSIRPADSAKGPGATSPTIGGGKPAASFRIAATDAADYDVYVGGSDGAAGSPEAKVGTIKIDKGTDPIEVTLRMP